MQARFYDTTPKVTATYAAKHRLQKQGGLLKCVHGSVNGKVYMPSKAYHVNALAPEYPPNLQEEVPVSCTAREGAGQVEAR